MDFVHLAESGKYKREELREDQEEFIAGMEYVKDVLLMHMAEDNDFTPEEGASTLEKMAAEIRMEALEEIRRYIYSDMCEFIVSMLDENACEEEGEENEE